MEVIHSDTKELSRKEWADLLGIKPYRIGEAIWVSGAREDRYPLNKPGTKPGTVVTPISEFPKIVTYFRNIKSRSDINNWALGVNTDQDFEVTAPSGTRLVYEYPSQRPIGIFRKFIDEFFRYFRDFD